MCICIRPFTIPRFGGEYVYAIRRSLYRDSGGGYEYAIGLPLYRDTER